MIRICAYRAQQTMKKKNKTQINKYERFKTQTNMCLSQREKGVDIYIYIQTHASEKTKFC